MQHFLARLAILLNGRENLVKCRNCGIEVTYATKAWPVTFKRKDEHAQPKFLVGIFECPKCKSKFRSRVESPAKTLEISRLQDLVEKVKNIHKGLILTKKTLHEKIGKLETERGSLVLEIGDLQRDAEDRAEALEMEICQLREEIKSLKEFLGSREEGVK